MKKIKNKFYVVATKENVEKKIPIFETFACSREEVVEFVFRRVAFNHLDHYKCWCNLHKEIPNNYESIKKYCDACVSKEELNNYRTAKMSFYPHEVAAMARIVNGCEPVGCSYETVDEIKFNLLKASPDTLEEIAKKLQEEFNKLLKKEGE